MEKQDIINFIQKTYSKINFLKNYRIPRTFMTADLYLPSNQMVIFIHQNLEEQSNENFDDELLQSLGYLPAYYYLEDGNQQELASFITDIENYLEILNDDITLENIKKNCKDFIDIEEFANKIGVQIINAGNKEDPFQISLLDAKDLLNILPGTEKDKRLMKLFYSEDDDETSVKEAISDNESLYSYDEMESATLEIKNQNGVEREYVCFNEGEDYKIQGVDFLLTREAFSRLAIMANTPEGKFISKQFHKFLEMIPELIKICEKRKNDIHRLINKKRAKALLSRHHKRKLNMVKKQGEDKINYLLNIIKNMTNEMNEIKSKLKEEQKKIISMD